MLLKEFDAIVSYRAGKENQPADALSRHYYPKEVRTLENTDELELPIQVKDFLEKENKQQNQDFSVEWEKKICEKIKKY